MDIGRILQNLDARLKRVERSPRLSHASIDNTSVEVRDSTGNLRGLLGVQADGTTAVNIVNGAAPPTPSTPTVAPALGGIAVGWDGLFADGSATPLDWSRIEVHASATPGFTPTADTLKATQETPQGAISYIPVSTPTYVQILARNPSGTPSAATPEVGPYSARPVAGDIGIGEIVATMISDGAVTTPKLFANAVTTAKLAAGSVDATALAATAITGKTITGGTITGTLIQTAASGEHITLNEAGANKVIVYNSSGTAIGELSAAGLLVKGTNGALIHLDPNNTYPNLRLTNAAQSNTAYVIVSGGTSDANIGVNSGTFTANGFSDMMWRTFIGSDFGVIERIRQSNSATVIGGRLDLRADQAAIGYYDTTATTVYADIVMTPGLAKTRARAVIQPTVGDTNSVLYLQPGPSHTGYVIRCWDPDNSVYRFAVDKSGNTDINGILTAGNVAAGRLTITPVANTPTSQNVTGLNLKGTNIRVVACAATSQPGAQVTGVGVTNQSSTGFTVWVTRTNTTNTNIEWIAFGV